MTMNANTSSPDDEPRVPRDRHRPRRHRRGDRGVRRPITRCSRSRRPAPLVVANTNARRQAGRADRHARRRRSTSKGEEFSDTNSRRASSRRSARPRIAASPCASSSRNGGASTSQTQAIKTREGGGRHVVMTGPTSGDGTKTEPVHPREGDRGRLRQRARARAASSARRTSRRARSATTASSASSSRTRASSRRWRPQSTPTSAHGTAQ